MIQIMALRVLREVAENIQNVDFYSIMCDKATDVKSISELAVCLRWVGDELEAHDEFIGLKNMGNTDADSIVQELKDVLLRIHFKLDKCRRQCYDGCSTMSGSKTGVTVQTKSEEECALYTHSYAHSINLAVGDTMKVCPVLKDTIDNIYELKKLVKMSSKRDTKFHSIQAENNSLAAMEMTSLLMDLKTSPYICFVIPNRPFVPIVSKELSDTLMSCKSCGIGRLKTVLV